ncbi:MAG: type III pantothenate kinase [Clostridia bacterium]|nr:type III pantothenate kinase [Clostridia bacterium]
MILAIDIGNTNIVMGCCENGKISFRERLSTNHSATSLEYAALFKTAFEMHTIDYKGICGAIVSSVVPSVTSVVKAAVKQLVGVDAMVVGPGLKTGLSIVIDDPGKLGSDLVVDAVAGISEYSVPLIIIDMGTATTLSVVDSNKRYLGGIIVPGLSITHDALVSRTSQLPKIALEAPEKAIGTNTVDCIKSGLIFGTAGTLDGLIERICDELGQKCTVVATGGLAGTVVPLCRHDIIIDDDLLLKGLMIIYNKNVKL